MKRKFRGRVQKKKWNWWQLLLFRFFWFWCAFDPLIFPILFKVLKSKRDEIVEEEKESRNKGIEQSAETMCACDGV